MRGLVIEMGELTAYVRIIHKVVTWHKGREQVGGMIQASSGIHMKHRNVCVQKMKRQTVV